MAKKPPPEHRRDDAVEELGAGTNILAVGGMPLAVPRVEDLINANYATSAFVLQGQRHSLHLTGLQEKNSRR